MVDFREFIVNPCVYESPDGSKKGQFTPTGGIEVSGKCINPTDWRSKSAPYQARLLVGFNVGKEARWKMDNVVSLVREFLHKKGMPEDSSFVYQRGVYTHKEGEKEEVITEEGAQVIILKFPYSNWDKLNRREFAKFAYRLGEHLADELLQRSVVVEISKGGDVIETKGMLGKHYRPPTTSE
jgi:hypothetical protein